MAVLLSKEIPKINIHLYCPAGDDRSPSFSAVAHSLAGQGRIDEIALHSKTHGETLPFMALSTDGRPRHFYQAHPFGMEERPFSDLISILVTGTTSLSSSSLGILKKIQNSITIRVLITSSCPFCPQIVGLVNQIAAASPLISAWIVDLDLFPEKMRAYQPKAAPTTILGEEIWLTGLVSEKDLIGWVERLDGHDYFKEIYRNDLLEKRMEAAVQRLALRPQDLPTLTGLLMAEEFGVKLGAMAVIEQLIEETPHHHGVLLESLLPFLQDESDQVVGDAAYLIGLLQDDRKTAVLTPLLSHPNPEVIEAAFDGLTGK
jgi:alkyl hydroperoxide reductase subunit AhpF